MVELVSVTPLDDSDDDAGYASEDWNEECDIGAAFLDHRRQWKAVLT